eukprot:COSAG01_NODE_12582_length_1716_cov_1.081633_3_plen_187_part_01
MIMWSPLVSRALNACAKCASLACGAAQTCRQLGSRGWWRWNGDSGTQRDSYHFRVDPRLDQGHRDLKWVEFCVVGVREWVVLRVRQAWRRRVATPHPAPRTPTAAGERWSEGTPGGGDGGQYAGRAARGWQTTEQGCAVGRLQGAVVMAEARGKQQTVQPGGSGMIPHSPLRTYVFLNSSKSNSGPG